MSKYIPLSVPNLDGSVKKYTQECLDTGWVSTVGPFVEKFEKSLAQYFGTKYAVATSSGTTALHLILLAAGIGPGDEVLAPTLTFVATINPIRYVGAYPVLVDVDSKDWCINLDLVEHFLENDCKFSGENLINLISGRTVKAIMPVHLFGNSCNIERLKDICKKYNLLLLEDATESVGSTYKALHLGTLGLASALSFNGNKIITTGSGGAILTNDENFAYKTKHLSTQAKLPDLDFIHDQIGYNYRMSNIHAAIGLSQLEMLNTFIDRKRQIADNYLKGFSDLLDNVLIQSQNVPASVKSNYWLNVFLVNKIAKNKSVSKPWRFIIDELKKYGIESRPVWMPMHSLAPHNNYLKLGGEVADHISSIGVCLPSSSNLQEVDQQLVIDSFRKIISSI